MFNFLDQLCWKHWRISTTHRTNNNNQGSWEIQQWVPWKVLFCVWKWWLFSKKWKTTIVPWNVLWQWHLPMQNNKCKYTWKLSNFLETLWYTMLFWDWSQTNWILWGIGTTGAFYCDIKLLTFKLIFWSGLIYNFTNVMIDCTYVYVTVNCQCSASPCPHWGIRVNTLRNHSEFIEDSY